MPLKSLTTRSSLTELLRALYRMGMDYCVLPPSGDFADVVVFTKDQLVSLIERSSSDAFIAEIPKRVASGLFKPVAIFKSDSSSSDFVSKGGFAEPERLQVLIVEDDGAKVSSLREALAQRMPDFPEWWEAPVPFAMCGYGKLHVNRTAMLMFGPDLKRMPVGDIPDKNEFLVTLEGGQNQSHCSVTFRRLEGDTFALEDSTSDIVAAEDVAWWAAVGKAWAATLDEEKRAYRRCGEEEAEPLRAENTVIPCQWEGELLGYFCVENPGEGGSSGNTKSPDGKPGDKTGAKKRKSSSNRTASRQKKKTQPIVPQSGQGKRGRPKKNVSRQNGQPENEPDANDPLNALGPQTLGLLVPGAQYPVVTEDLSEPAKEKALGDNKNNKNNKTAPAKKGKARG
jgi:hypothetical protein